MDSTLELINWQLSQLVHKMWNKDLDSSLVHIDNPSVNIVRFTSENGGIDGHKKVKGRKRHIVVDILGFIVGVIVHAANHFDSKKGIEVIARCDHRLDHFKKIIVDQACRGALSQTSLIISIAK